MFPDLLSGDEVERKLVTMKTLRRPIWSSQKACLIEQYLAYFVMITRHGTYIDGFAGPQAPDHEETWSAKRVIESRPRFLRHFFLCELDTAKVEVLNGLWAAQPPRGKRESKRTCEIFHGDFNVKVNDILSRGTITEREATFALLDQRMFECHWETVRKLAMHKLVGNKIELFYFLGVKWLHRSIAGTQVNEEKIDRWWGNGGWRVLRDASQRSICDTVARRLKEEFGYRHVMPFPIFERDAGQGAVMYFMIHASDHDAAPGLMWRAYHKIGAEPPPEQGALQFEGNG